jgi:outer membrane protein
MNSSILRRFTGLVFIYLIVMPGIATAQSYDEIALINNNLVRGHITQETGTDVTIEVTEILIQTDRNQFQRFSRDGTSVILPLDEITEIRRGLTTRDSRDRPDGSSSRGILLTVDSAIEIAMGNSYRIRQLELMKERTRLQLRSSLAGLKSQVYMNLRVPEISAVAEEKWNSSLKKNEIIHEDTRRWQMDLSIRQPVVLFGYPTNGYLSLNNKIYKYLQKDGETDIDYYNRFFVRFEQPIFLPNFLKNNIERAELELEENDLEYIVDRVRLIDQISDDYYDLFEVVYKDNVYRDQVQTLETIERITQTLVNEYPSRAIELTQVQVELTNARERDMQNKSSIRREITYLKQRLHLAQQDSVYIEPVVSITPVEVDVEKAVQNGYSLHPNLRNWDIRKRRSELTLSSTKGRDAFHINIEATYGLENNEDRFESIWEKYDRSHSVMLNAYVPIWDWGRRRDRVQAAEISVERMDLYIEETRISIRNGIVSAADRLKENQQRILNIQDNTGMASDITKVGIEQFQNGTINAQAVLLMLSTQQETEMNFLAAYLSYRRALQSLMLQTYYDYENDMSLFDKFGVDSYYSDDFGGE